MLSACSGDIFSGLLRDGNDSSRDENRTTRNRLSDVIQSGNTTNDNRPPRGWDESPESDFDYKAVTGGIEITKYNGTSIRVRIPEKIEGVPVTSIGNSAFSEAGIMEVYIPNSVTNIGNAAFAGNAGLISVTIPNDVESIGMAAFSNCSGLTNILIPDSVTSLGNGAFSDCTGLTRVTIGNGVTNLGSVTPEGNESSTERGIFFGCTELTNVILGSSVRRIGDRSFAGTNLESITIPDGVTIIGSSAFAGTNLTTISIPASVTDIGSYAFAGTKLTNVTLENGLTNIGNSVFAGCSSLTSIAFPDSVTSIGRELFNCYYVYRSTNPWDVSPRMPERPFDGTVYSTCISCESTFFISATYKGTTYDTVVTPRGRCDLPEEFYIAVNGGLS